MGDLIGVPRLKVWWSVHSVHVVRRVARCLHQFGLTLNPRRDLIVSQARPDAPKAYFLRELIANGLDDLEDYYLAAATLERVRKGDETVYLLDNVERDLGTAY